MTTDDLVDEGQAWVTCSRCHQPFTDAQWDDRHWGDETDDEFHAECCPKCEPIVGADHD